MKEKLPGILFILAGIFFFITWLITKMLMYLILGFLFIIIGMKYIRF